MTKILAKPIVIIVAVDLLFFAMAIFGSIYHQAWMAFGFGSITIITFLGMLYIQRSIEPKIDLKVPIASAVTLIYILLVVTWAFYRSKGDLPQMTETLMSSFTSITGIVIAFYFGSSAYIEVHRKQSKGSEELPNNPLTKSTD